MLAAVNVVLWSLQGKDCKLHVAEVMPRRCVSLLSQFSVTIVVTGRHITHRIYGVWNKQSTLPSFLINVQQDATYSVYYISVGSSTCFGC